MNADDYKVENIKKPNYLIWFEQKKIDVKNTLGTDYKFIFGTFKKDNTYLVDTENEINSKDEYFWKQPNDKQKLIILIDAMLTNTKNIYTEEEFLDEVIRISHNPKKEITRQEVQVAKEVFDNLKGCPVYPIEKIVKFQTYDKKNNINELHTATYYITDAPVQQ